MPRWLTALVFMGVMLVPSSARAQAPVAISGLLVQLWPEYDQPSMLVLYDFQVADVTELPISITIRIPKAANLTAVAMHGENDALLNADYRESSSDEAWQSIIVQVQSTATYRVEYVQPLSRSGDQRQFSYVWPGDYQVEDFNLSLRMPADAAAVTAEPALRAGEVAGASYYLGNDFGFMARGTDFTFDLTYTRTSESLVAPPQDLQPSQPLNGSTPGRVMLSNYLPYILGALGVALVVGGSLYFWQSSRAGASRAKRHRAGAQRNAEQTGDVHCHQCGARAEEGDRFCRVCGTRLRQRE